MAEATPPTLKEFAVIWNQMQGLSTPPLHRGILGWLEMNWKTKRREMLLLVFRDAGKSSLVGLFCAWLLMRDPNKRILVIAADDQLARKMVRNVKQIIESHPFTQHLVPPKGARQWGAGQFTVRRSRALRDPSMLAKGLGANITGSRADIIICDDVEVPRTANTARKREELRQRLREISYVLTPKGAQIYVGTPHARDSLYAERGPEGAPPFLAGFARLKLPIYTPDGQSRWPERFPPEEIEKIRRHAGPAKFASQMLLEPTSDKDGRLNPDLIAYYDDELDYREANGAGILTLGGKRLVSVSCWWDPSFGRPDGGDRSALAAVFTDVDGRHYLHRLAYLTHDPKSDEDAATQLCRQVAAFARALYLPAVQVESNGVGKFLPGLLRKTMTESETPCAVIERHSTRAKDARIIEAFDARLAAGNLHAHVSVRATPFIEEMRAWRPGDAGAGDDGLDAVAGCLLSEPVRMGARLSQAQAHRRPHWQGAGQTRAAQTDFKP